MPGPSKKLYMKKLIFIFSLSFFFYMLLAKNPSPIKLKVTASILSIRDQPGLNGKIIGQYHYGDIIDKYYVDNHELTEIDHRQSVWYTVFLKEDKEDENKKGYVFGGYLNKVNETPENYLTWMGPVLVYEKPDLQSKVAASLDYKEKILVLEETQWYIDIPEYTSFSPFFYVEYKNGLKGWIPEYFTVNENSFHNKACIPFSKISKIKEPFCLSKHSCNLDVCSPGFQFLPTGQFIWYPYCEGAILKSNWKVSGQKIIVDSDEEMDLSGDCYSYDMSEQGAENTKKCKNDLLHLYGTTVIKYHLNYEFYEKNKSIYSNVRYTQLNTVPGKKQWQGMDLHQDRNEGCFHGYGR